MAEEMVERLGRMRRVMAKLLREGREREFSAVSLAYEVLKRQQAEQVGRPERERAVPRVVRRPRELSEAERWRRAIRGRYGSGMTATIWRPGRGR
jgi:hypothetical protein